MNTDTHQQKPRVRIYRSHDDDPQPEVIKVPQGMEDRYIDDQIKDTTFRTQLVEIRPELAAAFLRRNTRNRNKSAVGEKKIGDDMERGRFHVTHQGLGVYQDGTLSDGQTRLSSGVRTGKTFLSLITWGEPLEAAAAIDKHRARSDADSIRIGGLSNWIAQAEISVIKMIAIAHLKHSPSYSAEHIAELGEFLKDQVTFANLAFSAKKRYITTAPVLAALAMAKPYVDEYRLLEFAEVMITGMPVSANAWDDAGAIRLREGIFDPTKTLHRIARTGGQTARKEMVLYTQRAIKAFADREHIKKLYKASSLIYRVEGIEDYL